MYNRFFKRLIDVVLSSLGIIIFAIPMMIVSIIIKIDSRGPVFFKQKRFGIHKTYFDIIKFRSMPTDVPKDVPTHLFNSADILSPFQRFIRKSSFDELPQLFNIFLGNMSIIGPRPALWNQDDLVEERDKYGANDIKPGLTGWAQINGRDEIDIEEKARLDGEYTKALTAGGFTAFSMDIKCFLNTIVSVAKHDGVVDGVADESVSEKRTEEIMH